MKRPDLRPTTTPRPIKLRHDSVPMRLDHEAKQLGTWDPRRLQAPPT
jgi:hypothetical protein